MSGGELGIVLEPVFPVVVEEIVEGLAAVFKRGRRSWAGGSGRKLLRAEGGKRGEQCGRGGKDEEGGFSQRGGFLRVEINYVSSLEQKCREQGIEGTGNERVERQLPAARFQPLALARGGRGGAFANGGGPGGAGQSLKADISVLILSSTVDLTRVVAKAVTDELPVSAVTQWGDYSLENLNPEHW